MSLRWQAKGRYSYLMDLFSLLTILNLSKSEMNQNFPSVNEKYSTAVFSNKIIQQYNVQHNDCS